ncbi:MAG: hypothetical protein IJT91_05880 [Clostridia bacterium]|nr:hypothetical protein [Clostridia bacterium]
MKKHNENPNRASVKKAFNKYLAMAVMILLTAVLAVSVSYARYSNSKSVAVNFRYTGQADQVYLLKDAKDENNKLIADANGNYSSPGGWTSSGIGSYSLSFLLANGNAVNRFCMYSQDVSLGMFISEGVGDISNISATLTVEGNVYTAVFTPVSSSSALYGSYGAGWTARFTDASGNEPGWTLSGGVLAYKEMTLSVSGTNDYPAAVTLIASGVSAD